MFATLLRPDEIAGHIISNFAVAAHKTLTSQQAQCVTGNQENDK
ncbi:hypothetical protein PN498_09815 [Oscillatoria sp. CS-180]|nr:hypothetical protein [Oscillatoria sp. CS-180]MDB9526281.1 hypothetical protein [Oscillatoria sp. CS-180]